MSENLNTEPSKIMLKGNLKMTEEGVSKVVLFMQFWCTMKQDFRK